MLLSDTAFRVTFGVLHLLLAGGAVLAWMQVGLLWSLLIVIAGVGFLQAWLRERRLQSRRREVGRRRRVP